MHERRTIRIEANGLSFAADEMGEGRDVALLLHGFPESRFSWRHQLAPLAAAGWRVVAPDMRGYGDTSRPRHREAYRLDALVADAAAVFDALQARRRLLVGHDWGAFVAWTFALRNERPLDGLVVMNVPHPAIFRAVLRRSSAQRRRSWYIGFFQLPVLPELALTAFDGAVTARLFSGMAVDKSAFSTDVLRHYRDAIRKPGAAKAALDYYRANLRASPPATETPVIKVPVLMIWGEADTALGLELTEGYEPYVEDFTLNRLPGVSHWVQQEAPAAVNARLLAWLRAKGLAGAKP